ncbi:F-box domain containing protein [Tanacetum coccineum]
MGSRHDEKRMNVEGDRLSSLPDDLIHKILSSISLKQAIETSTLSSRWRYIWTSMPYLDFSTESFSKWKMFSKFYAILSLEKCLSLSVELFSHQPPPFAKLKSLKIYPAREILHVKANVYTLVKTYLLDSSPGATLTVVLREEIRAHKLMEKLQKLLNRWKANSDKNTAHVDQGEAENQRAQQHKLMEKLQKLLNRLLKKLPASQRAKMQPMYTSLYAEADTFMDDMMDRVRIQCDKKLRRSNAPSSKLLGAIVGHLNLHYLLPLGKVKI